MITPLFNCTGLLLSNQDNLIAKRELLYYIIPSLSLKLFLSPSSNYHKNGKKKKHGVSDLIISFT